MDSSQQSDEGLGQFKSTKSCHILRKLSEEDKVETFDSEVTLGLFSERSEHVLLPKVISDSDCKDPSIKRARATENWRLLLHKLGEKKTRKREAAEEQEPRSIRCKSSHDSLKYKRSKHLGMDRMTSSSSGSTSSKVISDLKRELFDLPPQQSCVVREEPPKFAQGLLKDRSSDWCWQQHSGLISVDITPNTSSSCAEATQRNTSQIKRRPTKGKVSTSGDEISAKAAKGKKSPSISSGSTGRQFPNFRQRQQELHRYRVLIEQRRLDLLELRIAREREEAKQYMILFHKKMQIKDCNEAYGCSNI